MPKNLLIVFLLFPLFMHDAYGQTTRYWSLNFASEPSILAGAVVGGFAENQAAYYNPATISESKSDNIGLSGEILQLDFYNAKNAFGRDIDMKLSQFNVLPSYVSIFLKSRKNPDLSMQLALLTRDKNDFDISESIVGNADIYPSLGNLEEYSVLYESTLRYRDVWAGGGVAYKLNERLSLGASAFACIKRMTDKLTRSINIVSNGPPDSLNLYSNVREISRTDVTNYKLQTKIGLQYELPKWRIGVNISLPSLLIFSQAKRYREVGISQVYSESTGEIMPDDVIIGTNDNAKGEFRDPLSIAVGVNYCPIPDKDMIGVSIEYFKNIPVYKLVDTEGTGDFINHNYPDISGEEFLSLWYGASDVLNVSLGYRKYINEGLTLLGGVRTDFDYLKNVDFTGTGNDYNNFIKFYWDVIHITGGARFNISRHRFIVGAQYSYGKESRMRQLADFIPQINVGDNDLPFENLGDANVEFRYNSIGVFFGFIFNFLDKKDDPTITF